MLKKEGPYIVMSLDIVLVKINKELKKRKKEIFMMKLIVILLQLNSVESLLTF